MQFSIRRLREDALYRNSFIFVVGSLVANVFGYLYHLALGRLLRPEDYGEIASLLSVFLIISVLTGTIQTIVMKYAATYEAQNDRASVSGLQKYLGRWLTILGLVITVIFCVFSPLLSGFLHISSWWSVCIFGLVFLVTFNTSVYRGALQGLQRFGKLAGSLITESGIKLVVGAGLALLGFAVIGGITGIVIGVVAGFATAWGFSHYSRTSPGRPPKDIRAIIAYALPVTIVLLTTTLLYSIDVVLVKHYFSSTEAGYYAALSQLGKIIVFGTMAISGVMFPMVAEKLEKKENYRIVFWKACGIVSGLSLLAVITYFVAPGFVIHLLYGPEYLAGASLLGYIAIFMALYSIINVFVQFFLSLKSYGALWPLVIGCIAQICLLASWHSTLKQVILIIDWCLAAILGALFIYYVYQSHRLKISGKAFHSGPGV